MPQLNKGQLLERVRLAFQSSGWGLVFDSPNQAHPFSVRIFKESSRHRLLIYIWNITHGGGAARAADEFRIQLTGVTPPLSMQSGRQTLLLGWSEDFGVFAAFDPLRHQMFSTASPSIQIKRANLQAAANGSMSFYPRGNGEIAIAISPDVLADYVAQQSNLHGYGDVPAEVDILEAAAKAQDVPPDAVSQLPAERQVTVATISRLARESTFRVRVLRAYNHCCAVCDMQLGLVQAAHVVPVVAEGSTDETCNGLALCVMHHSGYDAALLAVEPNYNVVLSGSKHTQFEGMNLANGWQHFSAVRGKIILPSQVADRPKAEYLQKANEIRAFAA